MSMSPDTKALLEKCDALVFLSESLKERLRAQEELRKVIYETNRTVVEHIRKSTTVVAC